MNLFRLLEIHRKQFADQLDHHTAPHNQNHTDFCIKYNIMIWFCKLIVLKKLTTNIFPVCLNNCPRNHRHWCPILRNHLLNFGNIQIPIEQCIAPIWFSHLHTSLEQNKFSLIHLILFVRFFQLTVVNGKSLVEMLCWRPDQILKGHRLCCDRSADKEHDNERYQKQMKSWEWKMEKR